MRRQSPGDMLFGLGVVFVALVLEALTGWNFRLCMILGMPVFGILASIVEVVARNIITLVMYPARLFNYVMHTRQQDSEDDWIFASHNRLPIDRFDSDWDTAKKQLYESSLENDETNENIVAVYKQARELLIKKTDRSMPETQFDAASISFWVEGVSDMIGRLHNYYGEDDTGDFCKNKDVSKLYDYMTCYLALLVKKMSEYQMPYVFVMLYMLVPTYYELHNKYLTCSGLTISLLRCGMVVAGNEEIVRRNVTINYGFVDTKRLKGIYREHKKKLSQHPRYKMMRKEFGRMF